MKNTQLLIISLFLTLFQVYGQEKKNYEIEANIKMLKSFYGLYFNAMEKANNDSEKKLELIRERYLTKELVKRIKKLDLDYDPIVNGQDVDSNWPKTLSITYISKDSLYQMCTTNSYDNSKFCSYLRLKKIGNEYKISDVKVNDIESILAYTKYNEKEKGSAIKQTSDTLIPGNHYQYLDCSKPAPSLYLFGDEGQLEFYTQKNHWVAISITCERVKNVYEVRYNFLTGISGRNKDLDWSNLSTGKCIAELRVIDNGNLEFNWHGFYNAKSKNFLETKNPFDKKKSLVKLIVCKK